MASCAPLSGLSYVFRGSANPGKTKSIFAADVVEGSLAFKSKSAAKFNERYYCGRLFFHPSSYHEIGRTVILRQKRVHGEGHKE
jgi:hypothetical protein